MYNVYNFEANFEFLIIETFRKFLLSKNISSGSIRSYLSDVRHFLGWLILFLKSNKVIPTNNNEHRLKSVTPIEHFELTILKVSNFKEGEIEDFRGKLKNDRGVVEVTGLLKYVNEKVLAAYKNYQTSNNVPLKTINRRFSSLRSFGDFCLAQNWITLNIFDSLRSISQSRPFPEDEYHLGEFRTSLWKKGASKLTVKNYLNDIRQFLSWSKRGLPSTSLRARKSAKTN